MLKREAFTLIEVMVAVMIISVVILALIEMFSNNSHIFSSFNKKTKTNQYASFFISNPVYGFEKKSLNMYDLISDFKLESDLIRELKLVKVDLLYQEIERIDMSEFEDDKDTDNEEEQYYDEEKEVNSAIVFEIGKSIIKLQDSSTGLLRLRVE